MGASATQAAACVARGELIFLGGMAAGGAEMAVRGSGQVVAHWVRRVDRWQADRWPERLQVVGGRWPERRARRVDRWQERERTCVLSLQENFPYNKRDVLSSSQSPLIFLELKDILNFETFTSLLSDQELKQVMQFVSSVDMANIPNSLKSMFISSQFEGALSNFQQLLSEGMFDCSEMGLSPNVLGHYEQLLVLTDLAATGWMDQCSQLRTHNTRRRSNFQIRNGVKEKVSESFSTGDSFCSAYANYAEVKFPAGWSPLKSRHKTKEGFESCTIPGAGASTSPQHRRVYPEIGDGRYDKAVRSSELSSSDESVDNELMPGAQNHLSSFKSKKSSAYQLQRNLFSGFSYSAIFSEDTEENDSDNDMLVNVPSTMSFQQAVLL
ncbi:hypothetical protein O6H91_07G118600 [Diphasiastrum complanatum]|uniref:Uncharacterized protein n=1 Tax=Diphasiastrum complanatum TaxID=34168 RepID=A0ACC2D9B0_DIPCM|nr:hypothetical protein O6H91_07G118600 [Diphasiastrum complanatum]